MRKSDREEYADRTGSLSQKFHDLFPIQATVFKARSHLGLRQLIKKTMNFVRVLLRNPGAPPVSVQRDVGDGEAQPTEALPQLHDDNSNAHSVTPKDYLIQELNRRTSLAIEYRRVTEAAHQKKGQ